MATRIRNFAPAACAFIACAAFSLGNPAARATIIWGTAQDISGDTDVSDQGTLVSALNFNSTSTPVNGTVFETPTSITSTAVSGGDFTFSASYMAVDGPATAASYAPFANLGAAYDAVLEGRLLGDDGATTLTLNNLTAGVSYQLELWSDTYSGDIDDQITATDGNSAVIESDTSSVPGGLGQYLLGTFTADSSGQETITFTGSFMNATNFNAVQLRDLSPVSAVPDSGPGLLLTAATFGGVALFLRRRNGGRAELPA